MHKNTTKLGGRMRVVVGTLITICGAFLVSGAQPWLKLDDTLRIVIGALLIFAGPFAIFQGLSQW